MHWFIMTGGFMNTSKELSTSVLFQKLGSSWYAFAEINNEMVFAPLPQDVDPRTTKLELYHLFEEHVKNIAKIQRKKSPLAPAA